MLIALAVMALCPAAGGSGASCALASDGFGKTFINLTIPTSWDDSRPTWVLKATAERTIVAQSGSLGQGDVHVIAVEGDSYRFVGENGRNVTGAPGSIVNAVGQSPDGRLWIMAEHSRFLNQIPGNQFCLFVLDDDRWKPIGPRFGAPKEQSCDPHGLHFFGDGRPVTVTIDANLDGDNSTWQTRLRRLLGDRWAAVPGHDYIADRNSYFEFLWRADDAWLIEIHETAGRTTLDARWIKGPRPANVAAPFHLDSWPAKMHFFHFAVSPNGSVAAVGYQGDDIKPDAPYFVKLYHPIDGGTYKMEEAPFPPGFAQAIDVMEWSPTDALHVVTSTEEKVYVDRLTDGHWTRVDEGTEPHEYATTIMDPRLFFRPDGAPIVTWEKFVQHDQE